MRGQQSQNYFFQYDYPAFYRVILITLGSICLISGVIVNNLAPEYYLPFFIYGGISISCIVLAISSIYNQHLSNNLFDYSSFCYLSIYLGIVFLTYQNSFDIHFVIILTSAHILYSLSFRNFVEFSIFAISSLTLLVLCTFMLDEIPINKYIFNSIVSVYTITTGLFTWYKEYRYEGNKGHLQFLQDLLGTSERAIFLLNLEASFIYYRNPAAAFYSEYIFGRSKITATELFDLLQLDRQFIMKSLKNADLGEKEIGIHNIEDVKGNETSIEISIQKVRSASGQSLMLQLADITIQRNEKSRFENLEVIESQLFSKNLICWIVLDVNETVKSIRVKGDRSFDNYLKKPIIRLAPEFFPPHLIQDIKEHIQQFKSKGFSKPYIYKHRSSLGQHNYIKFNVTSSETIQPDVILLFEDVSEQHSIEESLRIAVQDYQLLFQQESQQILIVDAESLRIIDVNKAGFRLLQFSTEEIHKLKITDILLAPGKTLENAIAYIKQNPFIQLDIQVKAKDGKLAPAALSLYQAKTDSHDKIMCILQMKWENRGFPLSSTSNQSATFHKVFMQAPLAILILSQSGKILAVNNIASTLFKLPKTNLSGKLLTDFIIESHRGLLLDRLLSTINKPLEGIETIIAPTKDLQVPVELKATNIHWNEELVVLVYLDAISERKAAQNALAQSEERYRTLVEKMNEGLIMTDLTDTILFVNDRMSSLLGKERDEILGRKTYDLLTLVNPSKLNPIKEKIALRKKGISDQYEMEILGPGGGSIWVLITGSPHKDSEGNIIGTIAILTDITDRKLTEIKLKEKNQELDSFVYKASHDLKGPLASIIGVTNIAQTEVNEEKAKKYFQLISQSTQRLDSILVDLIDVTRLNKADIAYHEIDIQQLIQEIIQSLKHLPQSKDIDFKVNVNLKTPLLSDSKLLISILQNLITNSITYYDSGKEQSSVIIDVSQDEDKVNFVIQDNGIGIPEKILGKVFNMFYRGNTKSRGSGLGLYIVKNAIEKLNGVSKLESKFSEGTTFSFSIPLQSQIDENFALTPDRKESSN